MNDVEALRRAVVAEPANLLLRLVLADWYEDHDEPAYAAMIRAQVDLDRRPEWDADVVRAKWLHPQWTTGAPFRAFLPEIHARVAEWPTVGAFERGLPAKLIIRDLHSFQNIADDFCEQYPITHLSLPTASLQEWRRFAFAPWLPRIQSIRFYGLTTPIEPLRVLAQHGTATGLRELTLERSGGSAVAEVLRDLFASSLGKRLTSLELRAGHDHDGEWIDAINEARSVGLKQLTLTTIDLPEVAAERLLHAPFMRQLQQFHFSHARVYPQTLSRFYEQNVFDHATTISTYAIQSDREVMYSFHTSPTIRSLRKLNLSKNLLSDWADYASLTTMPNLKCLDMSRTGLTDFDLWRFPMMPFWNQLVELDLRDNDFSGHPCGWLGATPPPNLAALVLSGQAFSPSIKRQLREHFGEVLLFR